MMSASHPLRVFAFIDIRILLMTVQIISTISRIITEEDDFRPVAMKTYLTRRMRNSYFQQYFNKTNLFHGVQ